ncbi:Arginine biosynthesis bifunctional protein ArgJ [Poriferisphaera corsica]|uniref:Arginine biosynthesis bifunctional protein ArgJ n=1 Tax=Poriferisphaera corsica TaxID=2528020 RepID=A0A517YVF5_9BACT|nr:bifunctional glutamate N-acetyltransferase/amino-acid acetyltransferase ArgJ [Poriferisphaera corsica]QDU34197.1 Arginine biosynthesis bifunctional protein ArgJ [Poriferisphaera corsica]
MSAIQDNQIHPGSITLPRGFRAGSATAGIKVSGKPDITVIAADRPVVAAGVFTRNTIKGAPVLIGMQHIRDGKLQAIVVNSGNSNVCTGDQGLADATEMCELVAKHLGCKTTDVLPSSTGVIGRPLPMDKIRAGINDALDQINSGKEADHDAAVAILTTDLVAKEASRTVTLTDGSTITLGGIAKGSGMIAPNMATMLAYITTDCDIDSNMLSQALKQAVSQSFNRITVDSDTSTSDTVIVLASGDAKNKTIARECTDYETFVEALISLSKELAYMIIEDGEGAERIFKVIVKNAATIDDADAIGRAVADSPLVKAAVHGKDPNWGRLAMAMGKTGIAYDATKLRISIGDIDVFSAGMPIEMDKDNQSTLENMMSQKEITFTFDLANGNQTVEWLGCDLSRDYIAINADYTT